jgi:hypothetical protein
MNASSRAEAKSNRALFGIIGLPSRNIEALAQQGLFPAGALVLHAKDVNLAVPYATGHIGIVGVGRQQPAGDAIGQSQQVLRAVDGPAHRLLVLIGELQDLRGTSGKFSWLMMGIQASNCPLASHCWTRCSTSGS